MSDINKSPTKTGLRKIKKVELEQHNKPGDLWIAVNGKVYDLSEF